VGEDRVRHCFLCPFVWYLEAASSVRHGPMAYMKISGFARDIWVRKRSVSWHLGVGTNYLKCILGAGWFVLVIRVHEARYMVLSTWPENARISHLATTVEITCEVNLVKKSCFQFGVLDCLIGLNRSLAFLLFDLGEAGLRCEKRCELKSSEDND
jgi:hypothetical protein